MRDRELIRDALSIFHAALDAAKAESAVRRHLSISRRSLKIGKLRVGLANFDRIFFVGLGKAAAEMGKATEHILGPALTGGLVLTKHGHAQCRLRRLRVFEAGHPIPDEHGVSASNQIVELLKELNARDLLIVAVSGGASALLSAPANPVTLAAKQETTDLLLRVGANIGELNAVRKHLSLLKGGRLAALAYPATIVGLLLSDVIGDPLDTIGSGPTAPDLTTFADAIAVLERFDLLHRVPEVVRRRLEEGIRGEIPETPKPRDPLFENVHNVVIGSNSLALEAAAKDARRLGYRPLLLSSTMQGESREVARVHAQILREIVASGNPVRSPACVLSGGETTVTVHGAGKGGRNQEFALAAAMDIQGLSNVLVLSAGTDGTDGPTDAAGAIATGETVRRAAAFNLNSSEHLGANNAYPFFDALGDLIRTGPTGTNVMDIHLMLVR
ncbi:MAG: glycerate kinase [Acidobacteriaceae bacterium]|nr:glycerate kinase [Acidobacteriaceae bacterium]